jgi:phenylpropionate dioxygenase-like ring-hydroxylating dioxygenase large terminal subunit
MGLTLTKNYEDLLGDGFEALLAKGTNSLDGFAAGLNDLNVRGPQGRKWTAALLSDQLTQLAADRPSQSIPVRQKLVTQPFPDKPHTAEEVLETGLLNLWYLVCRSSDVTDRPLALTRLNRNLVLWRNNDGKINVVENYCPHRGAPLSLGRVVNGNVVCPYHGLQIDGHGVVIEVPPVPDCPLVGRKAIKSYACRDFAGAIWVYISDDATAKIPEPFFPEELTSNEWSSFLFIDEWQCNWQLPLDNRVDPAHGSFLHIDTYTLGYGRKDVQLHVEQKPDGFETWRENQKGVNIDWHKVVHHPDNIFWITTDIPYPPSFGGGSFRINGYPTPIDRNSTYVWFYRSRKISGWQRDLWRFLYNNRLEARARVVVDQDRVLLETMSVEARRRESMIDTDIAVTRMRRLLHSEAARQLKGTSATTAAE